MHIEQLAAAANNKRRTSLGNAKEDNQARVKILMDSIYEVSRSMEAFRDKRPTAGRARMAMAAILLLDYAKADGMNTARGYEDIGQKVENGIPVKDPLVEQDCLSIVTLIATAFTAGSKDDHRGLIMAAIGGCFLFAKIYSFDLESEIYSQLAKV